MIKKEYLKPTSEALTCGLEKPFLAGSETKREVDGEEISSDQPNPGTDAPEYRGFGDPIEE